MLRKIIHVYKEKDWPKNTTLRYSLYSNLFWRTKLGLDLNNLLPMGEIASEESDGIIREAIEGELTQENLMLNNIEGSRKI